MSESAQAMLPPAGERKVPATETSAAPADAILAMIERAARDPAIDVDKLERLLGWRDAEMARAATLAFNRALAAAQQAIAPIHADSENEQTSSRYASYAALDRAIRSIYVQNGFSLTFDTAEAPLPEHVRIICDVSHHGGHTRRYHLDMPVDGKGARGGDVMSRTHAMGSGINYGRRYLLGMIFNLAIVKDDDGNTAGGSRPRAAAAPQRRIPAALQATPRFDELMAQEFPTPHSAGQRPPQRPRDVLAARARAVARNGRKAINQFCLGLTKAEYASLQPLLPELERLVQEAEQKNDPVPDDSLDIPPYLRRTR